MRSVAGAQGQRVAATERRDRASAEMRREAGLKQDTARRTRTTPRKAHIPSLAKNLEGGRASSDLVPPSAGVVHGITELHSTAAI